MYSHRQPDGVPVDILARSIDQDDELTRAQKAERAFQIGLPFLDLEVVPYVKRWVAEADRENVRSEAIEQLRKMLSDYAGSQSKRGGKIRATPLLERPLWDKLLSDD